jgi:hypothetical protein
MRDLYLKEAYLMELIKALPALSALHDGLRRLASPETYGVEYTRARCKSDHKCLTDLLRLLPLIEDDWPQPIKEVDTEDHLKVLSLVEQLLVPIEDLADLFDLEPGMCLDEYNAIKLAHEASVSSFKLVQVLKRLMSQACDINPATLENDTHE